MASSHIFRLGRIKGKNGIEEALKHNRREIQHDRGAGGHIAPERIKLNYSLHGAGNAREIAVRAKVAMLEAGIETPRKNGVMGVEILFSLPIDRHQQDSRPFFEDCLSWVQRNMQGELLAFDIHLDEAAPHAHAVILPLVGGRMQGRDLIGNTGNMNRLRNLFYSEVAKRYGLSQGSAKLGEKDKAVLARQVIEALSNDPMRYSALWSFVRDAIHADPTPYAQHLGLTHQPSKRQRKSFVQIMTSVGHGKTQNAI
ncbi:plasmid recombination protein [Methylobacillus gramineus]|uniref:plasmid recombination protein n=1 Tax=Methylobacillus gramineus TaxID=755169 RepID=UPI001D000C65|nr:plasmid recombination protein [Methylobacillus gramineus]MCB5184008.1 plasmid recombination protein [Methylobacillus gramineus]